MTAKRSTMFVDGAAGTILRFHRTGFDPETGEVTETADVLLFGPPSGRDAVRVPAVRAVSYQPRDAGPLRTRDIEVRWLAGWLGACKRQVDPAQRDMLRILIELAA